jgi:hypothetical protein
MGDQDRVESRAGDAGMLKMDKIDIATAAGIRPEIAPYRFGEPSFVAYLGAGSPTGKHVRPSLRSSKSFPRTGFTAAVVLTLGLASAPTPPSSAWCAACCSNLPHQDGGKLMFLRQSIKGPGGENIAFSVPEINDFGARRRPWEASPSILHHLHHAGRRRGGSHDVGRSPETISR